jgi:hypothetical protein
MEDLVVADLHRGGGIIFSFIKEMECWSIGLME